jgi:ABC-type nitrate/sulfonate/bicarbonate transport system substrate-binding protein
MNKIIIFIIGFLLIILSVFIFKYYVQSNKKYKGPVSNVNLQLKWKHQAQFAGNYVAIEKGFYEDEGMIVNPIPFDFKGSVVDIVVSGAADFGIGAADELILARSKGVPIKAIAVIYRINPTVAYSLKKSNITKPQDFVGKTVGIQKTANIKYMYGAMMTKLGIDRNKINEVDIGHDASELLDGSVDVSTGYIINEPNLVKEAGQDVNTILLADYGVDMYADVLFTTDNLIETNPSLVERFVRSTINGWSYALENESEAVNYILKYATSSNRDHESLMLRSSAPLIHTGTANLGSMDDIGWGKSQKMLNEQKLLEKQVDLYTMRFINLIYNK